MLRLACALAVAYLLGSIPTGLLLVWKMKRIDIRTIGSGNIGATNALRTAGKLAGAAVLLLDGLKGAAAVTLVASSVLSQPDATARLACGVAAVVGHTFPVFLGFRGGKGVATTIGVLLTAMPGIAAAALAAWAAGFLLTRYVSVGSLALAIAVPVAQWASYHDRGRVLLGVSLAALIIGRHRANIERLLQGTEHRVAARKAP